MPLKLIHPGVVEHDRILVMGEAKQGKTPFALAASQVLAKRRNPNGKTIYMAWDPNSEFLSSVPPAWYPDIHTFRPTPAEGQVEYDPIAEAFSGAMADWKKLVPDAELLIWDSGSHMAEEQLQFIADSNFFSGQAGKEKHVIIGNPGEPGTQAVPVMGDYLAIKGVIERWVKFLFRQPLDVIVITHLESDKAQADGRGMVIGPALVGKALVRDFGRHFQSVLRVQKESMLDEATKTNKTRLAVYTEGDNLYIGGIRHRPNEEGDPKNPAPVIRLGDDLTKFWSFYLNTYRKENKQ